MADARIPIFDFGDCFDHTVEIGDKHLPIHIKRYSKAEMEAFEKRFVALVLPQRGTAELDAEATEKRNADRLAFFEETIREAITLDEGFIRNRKRWVTDGAGLIEVFHARKDVLRDFISAVYLENKLSDIAIKNSNSPRASAGGSDASIPTRGGDRPGPTAGNVESSSTAERDAATESSDAPDDASARSGGSSGRTGVH